MSFERQLKEEISRRQKCAARIEIENCTDMESLRLFALLLFDQNEAHKDLALTAMKTNLTGE